MPETLSGIGEQIAWTQDLRTFFEAIANDGEPEPRPEQKGMLIGLLDQEIGFLSRVAEQDEGVDKNFTYQQLLQLDTKTKPVTQVIKVMEGWIGTFGEPDITVFSLLQKLRGLKKKIELENS